MPKRMTKKWFDEMQEAQVKSVRMLQEFSEWSEKKYGFSYNDENLDWIIDSLDYGGGGLTLESFKANMKYEKKNLS